jgi:hypothetical protein
MINVHDLLIELRAYGDEMFSLQESRNNKHSRGAAAHMVLVKAIEILAGQINYLETRLEKLESKKPWEFWK